MEMCARKVRTARGAADDRGVFFPQQTRRHSVDESTHETRRQRTHASQHTRRDDTRAYCPRSHLLCRPHAHAAVEMRTTARACGQHTRSEPRQQQQRRVAGTRDGNQLRRTGLAQRSNDEVKQARERDEEEEEFGGKGLGERWRQDRREKKETPPAPSSTTPLPAHAVLHLALVPRRRCRPCCSCSAAPAGPIRSLCGGGGKTTDRRPTVSFSQNSPNRQIQRLDPPGSATAPPRARPDTTQAPDMIPTHRPAAFPPLSTPKPSPHAPPSSRPRTRAGAVHPPPPQHVPTHGPITPHHCPTRGAPWCEQIAPTKPPKREIGLVCSGQRHPGSTPRISAAQ